MQSSLEFRLPLHPSGGTASPEVKGHLHACTNLVISALQHAMQLKQALFYSVLQDLFTNMK